VHLPVSGNGKLERWHGSVKRECVRLAAPDSLDAAKRYIAAYVAHYNSIRLHSALDYVTPADKLAGLDAEIFAERDRKLEEVRHRRAQARRRALEVA
jgi:putative transposase